MSIVTVFKSQNPNIPEYYGILDVLELIKKGRNKLLINKIRSEKDHVKRKELKKQLHWILFSGKFTRRENNALVEHSGYICLDFDGFNDRDTMVHWYKKILLDKYCFALFLSPSGNGFKVIYKIKKCRTNVEHNAIFEAIAKYWRGKYISTSTGTNNERLVDRTADIPAQYDCEYFDFNGKGLNRTCFESYDPKLYINQNAQEFRYIAKTESTSKRQQFVSTIVEENEFNIFQKLIVWFEGRYSLAKGHRNESLYYLFSACRDFEIGIDVALQLVTNYARANAEEFETIEEELTMIARSAFSKPSAGKKMNLIPEDVVRKEEDNSFSIDGIDFSEPSTEGGVEETIETVEETNVLPELTKFWELGRSTYKIDFLSFKKFLQDNGFYRYEMDDHNFIFVRVIESCVEEVKVRHIKDFVLRCLESWNKNAIYNMIAENTKFKKEYLDYLDPIHIKWNKDTISTSWIYYSNCAIKITKEGISKVKYIDIDGAIWKTQKNNRNFYFVSNEEFIECDFSKFIANVCNNDKNRIKSFISGIGYLGHRFKSKSTVKAVIFNDEVISDDSMGGTGKGLSLQVLGTIRNIVLIPGADFNTGKDFAWQRVGLDTDIVVLDDVDRNFNQRKLFTFQTDGWPVRKLYQNEVFLKPEDSPKIAITTNFTLKGTTDSFTRRKFELELHPHYSSMHQPIDDFKRELVNGWDKKEFNLCDNFLAYCINKYIRDGLVEPKYVNLQYKKLVVNTSEEFVAFAETYLRDNFKYKKKDIFNKYKDDKGLGFNDYPNQKAFTKWMKHWAEYNSWQCDSRAGAGGSYFAYGLGNSIWQPGYDFGLELE